jgi:hypothetical protein
LTGYQSAVRFGACNGPVTSLRPESGALQSSQREFGRILKLLINPERDHARRGMQTKLAGLLAARLLGEFALSTLPVCEFSVQAPMTFNSSRDSTNILMLTY